jgi:two-component system LytT family response regulator
VTAIRVLIVDDEAPARAKLVRMLAADPRFVVAGEAADGLQAVSAIEALAPALVILDVQIPGLTGFEVLDAIGTEACPHIIFSTAYDQYAIAAFDAAAIDYLLKPYDAARFARALDRAFERLGDRTAVQTLATQLRPMERLLVKREGVLVPIRLADVHRLTAEDKYVRLHASDGEHVVRQPLRALEARLDPARFVRVHRSEIVALDAVTKLEPWTHGDALLVLVDGSTVVLSRTYREAFLERWR